MLVSVKSYITHPDINYGVNSIKLVLGDLTLWFSYSTCIAFQKGDGLLYLDKKIYTRTTRKHKWYLLTHEKAKEVDHEEFQSRLDYAITGSNN